jgi:pyrroline-5-carboxylate reductase
MNTSALHKNAPARIAFIGGGNMAEAIIGGLIKNGTPAEHITVVEPFAETAERLAQKHRVRVLAHASTALTIADIVVWAVKPQVFQDASRDTSAFTQNALHLSVAAGIRSSSICQWLGSPRVVRAMPNTPALVGLGMTGLFACAAVTEPERLMVEQVLQGTGQLLWLDDELHIDAVTALSGSGPAYVFYFLEAMIEAGQHMGLTAEQARQLATATFGGASALASQSQDHPSVLRQRVTSKGGTTHAAITALEDAQVKQTFVQAMFAAQRRAAELGDEFGKA